MSSIMNYSFISAVAILDQSLTLLRFGVPGADQPNQMLVSQSTTHHSSGSHSTKSWPKR
jgi:hypothetical protein